MTVRLTLFAWLAAAGISFAAPAGPTGTTAWQYPQASTVASNNLLLVGQPVISGSTTNWVTKTARVSDLGVGGAGIVDSTALTDPVTFVLVPDIQYMSRDGLTAEFSAMASWITNNSELFNIVGVIGLGDIVDHGTYASEWQASTNLYRSLAAADVPTLLAVGNHDYDNIATRSTTSLNTYYGPTWLTNQTWWTGTLYDGSSVANFVYPMTAGGRRWLVVVTEFGPRDAIMDWVQLQVDAVPNTSVIFISHSCLYMDGLYAGALETHADVPTSYAMAESNDMEEVWNEWLTYSPNLMATAGGHHFYGTFEATHSITTGTYGNQVLNQIVNFQGTDYDRGPIRLMTVYGDGTIICRTVYTDDGTFNTAPNHQFVVSASAGGTGGALNVVLKDNGGEAMRGPVTYPITAQAQEAVLLLQSDGSGAFGSGVHYQNSTDDPTEAVNWFSGPLQTAYGETFVLAYLGTNVNYGTSSGLYRFLFTTNGQFVIYQDTPGLVFYNKLASTSYKAWHINHDLNSLGFYNTPSSVLGAETPLMMLSSAGQLDLPGFRIPANGEYHKLSGSMRFYVPTTNDTYSFRYEGQSIGFLSIGRSTTTGGGEIVLTSAANQAGGDPGVGWARIRMDEDKLEFQHSGGSIVINDTLEVASGLEVGGVVRITNGQFKAEGGNPFIFLTPTNSGVSARTYGQTRSYWWVTDTNEFTTDMGAGTMEWRGSNYVYHLDGTERAYSWMDSEGWHLKSGKGTLRLHGDAVLDTAEIGGVDFASLVSAMSGKQDALVNSAGLRSALTDPTGNGGSVFSNAPTIYAASFIGGINVIGGITADGINLSSANVTNLNIYKPPTYVGDVLSAFYQVTNFVPDFNGPAIQYVNATNDFTIPHFTNAAPGKTIMIALTNSTYGRQIWAKSAFWTSGFDVGATWSTNYLTNSTRQWIQAIARSTDNADVDVILGNKAGLR